MKPKTLSSQSAKLLAYFLNKEQSFFTLSEAQMVLFETKPGTVRELISDMAKRGLLLRIKEGLYHIIPYEKNPEVYFPNWHIIASQLVKNRNYYIGYYSALEIHGLITQPSLIEQIVVDKQVKPSLKTINDVKFQFIYHKDKHFFGYKNQWIDNFNKVKCSDLEKTIIDCLFHPDYAGGIVEVAKAIFKVREKINWRKLEDYLEKFNKQSVIKRLGFILDLFSINREFREKLLLTRSNSFVKLDSGLDKDTRRDSQWRIQMNLDVETIRSSILT